MSKDEQPGSGRTEAAVRHSRWPGWIWSIPIAVLLVVGWLGGRALMSGGKDITITFDDVHDLKSQNSQIIYRGLQVGTVNDVALTKNGDGVNVKASVDESATGFLKSGTRFWLEGAKPSLGDLSSLGAVLSGPKIIMEPGPGEKTTHFTGLTRQPVAPPGAEPPERYVVAFDGAVGALKSGDPVTLRGFPVGEVQDVGFSFDAKTGAVATPVTLDLYPKLFHLENTGDRDSAGALHDALGRLIEKGMRARLARDPPLIGDYRVTLDMVPDAPSATLASADGKPQIPAAPGSGLDSIIAKVNKVPLDQIAQNILDMVHHGDELVSSPKIQDSIAQLDATLAQIHDTVANAGPQITKLVADLRKTAGDLDRTGQSLNHTARSADELVSGSATQNGLKSTIGEINQAARSVRQLADFLDRNPEALIQGKQGHP